MNFLKRQVSELPKANKKLPFDFQIGDSMAFLGMRGTGKTTLAIKMYKDLMEAVPEACGYIIDSNAAGDFTGWSGGYFGQDCPVITPSESGRQVVWQPPVDNYDAYEDFFRRLFDFSLKSGIPAAVFLDELSCLSGKSSGGEGQNHYYARLLKRGRRRRGFAGITVFSISQEFAQRAGVPRQTFSQMTHFARFYVQHPYDILEANKILHLPPRVQPEHAHGFWHARLDRPPVKPTYYQGLEQLGL